MYTKMVIIFLYLITNFHASTSNAIDPVLSEKQRDTTEVTLVTQPYYNAPVIVTAAVLTGVGLLYLTVLYFPAMAYKICYALGGCQNTMDSIVDELIGKQLGEARNIRSRNKRSVEYLEPLLITLAKAYEEYGDQDGKKNFKIPSYYTK